MNTTARAAVLGAAAAVSTEIVTAATRRRPGVEQPEQGTTPVRAPRQVTPDPDAFPNLGQLVTTPDAFLTAWHGTEPLPVGRVTGNPMRGRQLWITWADGTETYGDLDEFLSMRLVTTDEPAAGPVLLAHVAVLPRYEVRREAFDHSTDGSLGYKLAGFADALPADDDEYGYDDAFYTDRWQVATIRGKECTDCACVTAYNAECPF